MRRIIGGLAALAAAGSGTAWAHPGHGTTDPATVSHFVLEPIHAAPLVLLLLATGAVWLISRRRKTSARKTLVVEPARKNSER
jgi:hypothetical protein